MEGKRAHQFHACRYWRWRSGASHGLDSRLLVSLPKCERSAPRLPSESIPRVAFPTCRRRVCLRGHFRMVSSMACFARTHTVLLHQLRNEGSSYGGTCSEAVYCLRRVARPSSAHRIGIFVSRMFLVAPRIDPGFDPVRSSMTFQVLGAAETRVSVCCAFTAKSKTRSGSRHSWRHQGKLQQLVSISPPRRGASIPSLVN